MANAPCPNTGRQCTRSCMAWGYGQCDLKKERRLALKRALFLRLPVQHIGYIAPRCGARITDYTKRQRIVRQDLPIKQYRRMGVRDRLKGEEPYRVCKRCITAIERQGWRIA